MSDDILPDGTGSSGDIVVVMDSALWAGESGQAIYDCFGAVHEALPQPEPMFNVIQTTPGNFKQIFRTTKNIVMLKAGSEFRESKYSIDKNRWANNQLVLTVLAAGDASLSSILKKNCQGIRDQFLEEELKRLQYAYARLRDEKTIASVEKVIGERFIIPNDYKIAASTDDLVWIRKEFEHKGHQVSMGLVFYRFDYLSEEQFTSVSLMKQRDEFTKIVRGPVDGSYMKHYAEFPPLERTLDVNGKYVKELRGLWNMEKAFMGGPFIQLAFLREGGGQMICADGYVFAPKFDKREYVRELEAIMRSALTNPTQ